MDTETQGAETMTLTIGQFTLEAGSLTGPRQYFEDRGGSQAAVDKALRSTVFEFGLTESPSPEHALLIALQTDFAAWLGMKETERMLARC
jgi:hypothetical protein